jgi:polysaccharide pyruvyl transferase WcaK-like protein
MKSDAAVSIIGGTLTGNRGSEAMVCSLIRSIRDRRPDTAFHVFSYYPRDDRSVLSDRRVTIHSATPATLAFLHLPFSLLSMIFRIHRIPGIRRLLPSPLRALARSRMLIDVAGVSFMDGRAKFIPFNVLCILPALMLGVPAVKAAQGIGPCRTPLNRWASRFILSRCKKVYARGAATHSFISELRIPDGTLDLAADLAFLFSPGSSITKENSSYVRELEERLSNSAEKIVGICPSSVVYAKARAMNWDYISFNAELIGQMSAGGFRVFLYPNAVRLGGAEKLRNNDLAVIKRILVRYREKYGERDPIEAVDRNINADAIFRFTKLCHITLVSRFHAMILSLSAGIPVFVIGWSHKYQEVLSQFGLQDWALDCRAHRDVDFMERAAGLLVEVDRIKAAIASRLAGIRDQAGKQIDYVVRNL